MKHVACHSSVWSVSYWKSTSVFKTTECFVVHRKPVYLYVTNAFGFVPILLGVSGLIPQRGFSIH